MAVDIDYALFTLIGNALTGAGSPDRATAELLCQRRSELRPSDTHNTDTVDAIHAVAAFLTQLAE